MPMVRENVCSVHLREAKKYQGMQQDDPFPQLPDSVEPPTPDPLLPFLEITDAKEFAKAILDSQLFREYIVDGLRSRTVPPTVILRLMDYAEGWGKPPDRVEHEHSGQVVTEVRRVVIRVDARPIETDEVEALPPHGSIN